MPQRHRVKVEYVILHYVYARQADVLREWRVEGGVVALVAQPLALLVLLVALRVALLAAAEFRVVAVRPVALGLLVARRQWDLLAAAYF